LRKAILHEIGHHVWDYRLGSAEATGTEKKKHELEWEKIWGKEKFRGVASNWKQDDAEGFSEAYTLYRYKKLPKESKTYRYFEKLVKSQISISGHPRLRGGRLEAVRPYIMSRDQIRQQLKQDRAIAAKKHGVDSPTRLRYEGPFVHVSKKNPDESEYIHQWTIIQPGHSSHGSTISGVRYKIPKEESGRIGPLWHGTEGEIKNPRWFTFDKESALGSNKQAFYVTLKKPLDDRKLKDMYEKYGEDKPKDLDLIDFADKDTKFNKFLRSYGYDGMIVQDPSLGNKKVVVAFDPEQAKLTEQAEKYMPYHDTSNVAEKILNEEIRVKTPKKEGDEMDKNFALVIDPERFRKKMVELRKSKILGKKIPVRTERGVEFYKAVKGGMLVKGQGRTARLGERILVKGMPAQITAIGKDGVTARDSGWHKHQVLYKDVELIRSLEELKK
jgi:hypothetical protein